MKFPGGDRLRRLRDSLFSAPVDPQVAHEEKLAAIQEEAEARRRAQVDRANKTRLACANRLRPYIGRLFLVNNFESIPPEKTAARVSRAILEAADFADDTPLGISAILSHGRGNHEEFLETADALRTSFEGNAGQRVLSLEPQYEDYTLWLLSIARAAEDTAHHSNLPPNKIGCIAVVSAFDMNRQANIPFMPLPGGAFKLTGISEDARFDWQTVSVHPEDEWRIALQEEMERLRRDPDSFQ